MIRSILRRIARRLRRLVDPMWIPPEEMERELAKMRERIEQDRRNRHPNPTWEQDHDDRA